jgi:hypothetical protein
MRVQVVQKAKGVLLVIVCVGLFTGCASMSKDECKTANWETVGFSDGSQGSALSNIERHQKACAGIVTPDFDAYTRGHKRGVEKYCIAGTGYNAGVRGRQQNSVCAGAQWPEYHAAYQYGMDIYNAKGSVKHSTIALQAATQARVDAEHNIKVVEAELVSAGLPTHKRVKLLEQSKELKAALPDYDGPIIDAEHELGLAVDGINALYQNNPYANTKPIRFPEISIVTYPDPEPVSREHRHANQESEYIDHHVSRKDSARLTKRPRMKRAIKVFGRVVDEQMNKQCDIKGRGRFNQKRIVRAINGALDNTYLAKFNCSVSSLNGSVCNTAGNHWYASIGCEAVINGEEKLFGLTSRCIKKRGKLICNSVKEPNMENMHRKAVKNVIGAFKFNKFAKNCFSMKRGSGRVQYGNDNFSRCLSGLVLQPDENVCLLLSKTEDKNPLFSDYCYSALAGRSRDTYFCEQTVWANSYDKCMADVDRRR